MLAVRAGVGGAARRRRRPRRTSSGTASARPPPTTPTPPARSRRRWRGATTSRPAASPATSSSAGDAIALRRLRPARPLLGLPPLGRPRTSGTGSRASSPTAAASTSSRSTSHDGATTVNGFVHGPDGDEYVDRASTACWSGPTTAAPSSYRMTLTTGDGATLDDHRRAGRALGPGAPGPTTSPPSCTRRPMRLGADGVAGLRHLRAPRHRVRLTAPLGDPAAGGRRGAAIVGA